MILTLCTVFVLLPAALADSPDKQDEMWIASVLTAVNQFRHSAGVEGPYRGKCVMAFWNANAAEEESCKECLAGRATGEFTNSVPRRKLHFIEILNVVASSTLKYANRSGVHCCQGSTHGSDLIGFCCVWSQMKLEDILKVPNKKCPFCPTGLCPEYYYNEKKAIVPNSNLCSAFKNPEEKPIDIGKTAFVKYKEC